MSSFQQESKDSSLATFNREINQELNQDGNMQSLTYIDSQRPLHLQNTERLNDKTNVIEESFQKIENNDNKIQKPQNNYRYSEQQATSFQKQNNTSLGTQKLSMYQSEQQHHKLRNKSNKELKQIFDQKMKLIGTKSKYTDQDYKKIENDLKMKFKIAKKMGRKEFIKKKMMKILNNTESRRYKSLTEGNFQIINDRSIITTLNQTFKNQFFFQDFGDWIDRKASYCLNRLKIQTIHPTHTLNIISNVIESSMIMLTFFFYTLFCFYDYYNLQLFRYFNIATIVINVISSFIRINTGYFSDGTMHYNRVKILNHYRRNIFIFDLLGSFSMTYLLFVENNDFQTKVLCLPTLLKYQIFKNNINNIHDKMNLTGNIVHVWSLSQLMAKALVLSHVVATMYYTLAQIEQKYFNEPVTWIQRENIKEEPIILYIESLYWSMATITLIGTKGTTLPETLFAIVVLVCTVGVFATILSSVGLVWDEMEQKNKEYKRSKEILNQYLNQHKLTDDLQSQLHNYLKYSIQGHKEKNINQNFENITEQFPQHLKIQTKHEIYNEELLFKFDILTNNFSKKVVKNLINICKQEYYMPNQIIFERDIYNEPKLYLILSGKVELYQETGEIDSTMQILDKEKVFGYQIFFTNSVPYFNARSADNSFTSVLTITRKNFIKSILHLDEDYEKYNMIKDEIILNGISNLLETQCILCKSQDHLEPTCNLMNFQPNRKLIIQKQTLSIFQQRQKFFRCGEKIHSFTQIDILIDVCEYILLNPNMRKYLKIIQEYQNQLIKMIQQEEQKMYEATGEEQENYDQEEEENQHQQYIRHKKQKNETIKYQLQTPIKHQSHHFQSPQDLVILENVNIENKQTTEESQQSFSASEESEKEDQNGSSQLSINKYLSKSKKRLNSLESENITPSPKNNTKFNYSDQYIRYDEDILNSQISQTSNDKSNLTNNNSKIQKKSRSQSNSLKHIELNDIQKKRLSHPKNIGKNSMNNSKNSSMNHSKNSNMNQSRQKSKNNNRKLNNISQFASTNNNIIQNQKQKINTNKLNQNQQINQLKVLPNPSRKLSIISKTNQEKDNLQNQNNIKSIINSNNTNYQQQSIQYNTQSPAGQNYNYNQDQKFLGQIKKRESNLNPNMKRTSVMTKDAYGLPTNINGLNNQNYQELHPQQQFHNIKVIKLLNEILANNGKNNHSQFNLNQISLQKENNYQLDQNDEHQLLLEDENNFVEIELDKMNSYKFYFTHNNLENVIVDHRIYIQKIYKKRQEKKEFLTKQVYKLINANKFSNFTKSPQSQTKI